MKRKSLINSIRRALKTTLSYWSAHAASLKALKKVYLRAWQDKETGDHYLVKLKISPHGYIYRVTLRYEVNGAFSREESYLATYGWHCNGHLIAIGSRIRYLIFDPLQKLLYLEEWTEDDERVVYTYEQI